MTTPNGTFQVRDEATIQAAWLRTYRNGFVQYGLPAPNTLPGSEPWIRALAFARQLTVTESNGVVSVNNQMPDSAQGDYLVRWLSLLNLSIRPAGGSAGNITLNNSQATVVPLGATLVDTTGLVYAVAVGGTYAVNAQVPVVSLSGGVATNHVNGDVLRWIVPPTYCGQTVVVGLPGAEDGLVGGVDAESAENARARMVLRLQNPMGGGNWTTFALLAAASTPVVQAAFVYPAANGSGTVHVACVAYASTLAASNARNRDVSAAVMTSTVVPFVTGNVAEYAEVVVTTVTNQPVDVAVGLSLPAAPAASPPGPGGGWLDGIPWPNNSTGAASFKCSITAVASSTQFTCDAPTAPIPGVSRIAWLDPATWKLYTATVVAFTGTGGAFVCEIDTPWATLITSFATYAVLYVFPQMVNQTTYVTAFLGAFAAMGPGEKTNAAGLVSRAVRHPLPTTQFPYTLGNSQLQAVTDSDPNVTASTWYYRGGLAAPYAPTLPGSIANPPGQLVPKNIGFYPNVST
jgi:uncharacterized phage protein gp47/JayE